MSVAPDRLRVVLVETQGDANLGAVARSMACFGVQDLALVAPRLKGGPTAANWACHGAEVLEGRRVFEDLEAALEGTSLAVALTARAGKRRHRMYSPAEFTRAVLPGFPEGRLALVFGNEESGLANHHLDLCARRVTIPTVPEHASLNLGHSVTIMLYELLGRPAPACGEARVVGGKPRRLAAPHIRRRLVQEWATFMSEHGYPAHQATLAEESTKLTDILERSQLEAWEVNFFLGMVRHLRNHRVSVKGESHC